MSAIRTLLQGSIDYAGLFPPAELDLRTALENYARYATGPGSWALGRFILPVSQLDELEVQLRRISQPPVDSRWRFAALIGTDVEAGLHAIDAFNRRELNRAASIDSVEVKATSEAKISEIIRLVPSTLQTYIEVPVDPDPSVLIRSIGQGGRRAKVRTGGVTEEAFPRT